MRIRSWIVAVATLVGCGQDGADGDDGEDGESVEIEQLATGSSSCPAGGVRLTVGKTSEVVCNGERGAAGAMGATGAQGVQGAQGQSSQSAAQGVALVAQTITACVSLTMLPNSGVLANLTYKLVTFSDGSVFVSCSAQTTGALGASHAEIYAGWQQGAPAGACIVASDGSGTPDGGWWEFTVANGRPRAVYHDMGTADDLASFTFPAADCPTATRPN